MQIKTVKNQGEIQIKPIGKPRKQLVKSNGFVEKIVHNLVSKAKYSISLLWKEWM